MNDLPDTIWYDIFQFTKPFLLSLVLTNKKFYCIITNSDLNVPRLLHTTNFWYHLTSVISFEDYCIWLINSYRNFYSEYQVNNYYCFVNDTSLEFFKVVHSGNIKSSKLIKIVQKIIIYERLDLLEYMFDNYNQITTKQNIQDNCIRMNKIAFYQQFEKSFRLQENDLVGILNNNFCSDIIYNIDIRNQLSDFFGFMLENHFHVIQPFLYLLKNMSSFIFDPKTLKKLVDNKAIELEHFSYDTIDTTSIRYFIKLKLYDIDEIIKFRCIYADINVIKCLTSEIRNFNFQVWLNACKCYKIDPGIYPLLFQIAPEGFHSLRFFNVTIKNVEFFQFCNQTMNESGLVLINIMNRFEFPYDYKIVKDVYLCIML